MSTTLQQMAEAAQSTHPAQRASFLSLKYMGQRNKAAWVGLFADDGFIEDPVGGSVMDPEGKGFRGKEAIDGLWDKIHATVDHSGFRFEMVASFPCGDECANHWIGTHPQPDGTSPRTAVITVYKVNAEGKLLSLRGYFDASGL